MHDLICIDDEQREQVRRVPIPRRPTQELRLLTLLYRLANGSDKVLVARSYLLDEARKLDVLNMGRDEFANFHRAVLDEIHA